MPQTPGGALDTFGQLVEQYGFVGAASIVLVAGGLWYINKLWQERLRDKDAEIERLVREKTRLQDLILNRRLSSED